MNIVYLRSGSARFNLADQESTIQGYAGEMSLEVDRTIIEAAVQGCGLEDRADFLANLRSLKEGDRLLVATLPVLSHRVGELVKLMDCLFRRKVALHICDRGIILERKTPAVVVLHLLTSVREDSIQRGESKMGRPEGSRSASQFDRLRDSIVRGLKEGKSVSQLAREFHVSRTSLNDYIRSRNLKGNDPPKEEAIQRFVLLPERTCPLQEFIQTGSDT